MSVKAEISQAVAARLATITTANLYSVDVKKVLVDDIPMGIQMVDYELPAIFLLEGVDTPTTQQGCVNGQWNLILQLWHKDGVIDSVMQGFTRDVFKAIFANSAVAETNGAFRALHPKIVEFIPLRITPDLHMIEANRVVELSFNVHYRTRLYDL